MIQKGSMKIREIVCLNYKKQQWKAVPVAEHGGKWKMMKMVMRNYW